MLEKIKKELDPKIDTELADMQKRITDLESYISSNENTENEKIMLKVLTSKNTLKRLTKELPELEARDKEATNKANELLSAADKLRENKVVLIELERVKNQLIQIIETLNTGGHKKIANCFDIVLYGTYGSKYNANQTIGNSTKNSIIDKFMKNIEREQENLKREISKSEEFLLVHKNIKKYLKL